MASEWFYAINNQQYGPISESELRDLAYRGKVQPSDLVWQEGMSEWVPAQSVRGLLPEPRRRGEYERDPIDDRPRRPRPARDDSNRIACGVVALLFGWLGIHKFMLGLTTPGIIMLLVSLIGGLLFCTGAIVMSVIGFIEGIIYLTKTDEEFYQLYVVEKKEWF